MANRPVTKEEFVEWQNHPVTNKLMRVLRSERKAMLEGLVYDSYDNPEEVKGRCKAIDNLIAFEYEDLFQASEVNLG